MEIIVKNAVKPALIYTTMGNTAIFKDVSIGDILEREICWDVNECQKGNTRYIEKFVAVQTASSLASPVEAKQLFKVTYPKAGTYTVRILAKDSNGNQAENTLQVKIGEKSDAIPLFSGVQMVTLPSTQVSAKGALELTVGKQLKNQVLLYVKTPNSQDVCSIDADISQDANFDGIPNNDGQYSCNQLHNIEYTPMAETIVGRIFYRAANATKTEYKDFSVSFADFDTGLQTDELKQQYQKINMLIASIDDTTSVANADLRNLLITLRNDLSNTNKTRGNVVQINEFIAKNEVKLTKNQESTLQEILVSLEDYVTVSAL